MTHTCWKLTLLGLLISPLCPPGFADEPVALASSCVVFVADGAGNFQCTSKALRQAVAEDHLPLCVETVPWSHGKLRVLADTVDCANARRQGQMLASQILQRRQTCATERITLIGHCAGCAVVLAAAECLPPDTIDRIILMAPSAHTHYDLRAALCASREGIDSFFSHKDTVCLGFAIKMCGCLGGKCNPPAGRVGFQPNICTPEDASCYARLRQYPWDPSLACTGHTGGHFGCYQPIFLRSFILPLMCPCGH